MLRPLRIAVSVVSGICCVLVIVLWVRSYWRTDGIYGRANDQILISVSSGTGNAVFHVNKFQNYVVDDTPLFGYYSLPLSSTAKARSSWLGFRAENNWAWLDVQVPLWCLLAACAACATFPGITWRFSLRALLLATTAVAIVLGLIIYATRG